MFIVVFIGFDKFVHSLCRAMQYLVSFIICYDLAGEEKGGSLTLIEALLSCGSKSSVSLPHCTVCPPVVCDCGIS